MLRSMRECVSIVSKGLCKMDVCCVIKKRTGPSSGACADGSIQNRIIFPFLRLLLLLGNFISFFFIIFFSPLLLLRSSLM